MAQFCQQEALLLKSMKEIHFLCLQLEKLMREDILKDNAQIERLDFNSTTFEQPTEQEE